MEVFVTVLVFLGIQVSLYWLKPELVVKFIVWLLTKSIRNPDFKNQIENELGLKLAEIGLNLITYTSDEDKEIEDLIAEAKARVYLADKKLSQKKGG
jgi:hypothetical protein